jgi:hypothetical protein
MLFLNVGVGSLCFRRLVGVGIPIPGTLTGRRDGRGEISSNWGSALGYAATAVASARAMIEKRIMEYSVEFRYLGKGSQGISVFEMAADEQT